jgi:hypothetical protein
VIQQNVEEMVVKFEEEAKIEKVGIKGEMGGGCEGGG